MEMIQLNTHLDTDPNPNPFNITTLTPWFPEIKSTHLQLPKYFKPIIGRFNLAIPHLNRCDYEVSWKQQPKGIRRNTCGYSAPAIASLLLIFDANKIDGTRELNNILNTQVKHGLKSEQFIWVINETIGHFYDNIQTKCDATGVDRGIWGMIIANHKMVYEVNDTNLTDGVNLISFSAKGCNTTVHHSVLYCISTHNTCFIIDSWTAGGYGKEIRSRPVSYRMFNLDEVIRSLVFLNDHTKLMSEYQPVFQKIMINIFAADYEFATHPNPGFYKVYKTDSELIKDVLIKMYLRIEATNLLLPTSFFGGGIIKRNKYTKKNQKKNKRIKKNKKQKTNKIYTN